MEITKTLTEVNRNVRNREKTEICYLVLHYVGGVSTAENNAAYFKSEYRNASAHYFVDETSVFQVVLDKDIAWHCGTSGDYLHASCRNSNSIGIEMCVKKEGGAWYFEEETKVKTLELIKILMEKYDIPIENVLRHYDITGKICPKPFVDDNLAWQKFKENIVGSGLHFAFKAWELLNMKGIKIHEKRFDDKMTRGEVFTLLAQIV